MTKKPDKPAKQASDRRSRSTAEWVTFTVACAVLVIVVGAIASLWTDGPPQTPRFTVTTVGTTEVRGRFHVRARVENTGDETAENVQIVAELQMGEEAPVEAEQAIDFLSGGDREEVEFVFTEDPADGTLDIEVRSFKAR